MTESSTRRRCATSWRATSAAAMATTTSSKQFWPRPKRCRAAAPRGQRRKHKQEIPGRKTMGVEMMGARVARKEDKRFVTGRGRYTDDMTVPGMHLAAFIRSPHAHAKIKSIDTTA